MPNSFDKKSATRSESKAVVLSEAGEEKYIPNVTAKLLNICGEIKLIRTPIVYRNTQKSKVFSL